MQIANAHISSIAKEFWRQVGLESTPPYDIQGAVNLILPVDIICLSELSITKIDLWLKNRGISISVGVGDRALHGFILAFKGSGFIFIDGTDTEDERRYTIAHEASHFILDYKRPRDRAVDKLGTRILEVLDGQREATTKERIDGILSSISIRPFTHLLEKSGDGSFISSEVFDAENDADSLALELLAPASKIIQETRTKSGKIPFDEFKDKCSQLLVDKYGIPVSISNDYATGLAYSATGGPSLLSKFGF